MPIKTKVVMSCLVLFFAGVFCWVLYEDSKAKTPTYQNTTETYSLPNELKECQIFDIKSSSGSKLHVVKCPQAATTTAWTTTRRSGKATITEEHSVSTQ